MGNKKAISSTKLSDTLHISEHHDGFWLYDSIQGMNLALRAKTRDEAFTKALTYYQRRLQEREKLYFDLKSKVDTFVDQFTEDENDDS